MLSSLASTYIVNLHINSYNDIGYNLDDIQCNLPKSTSARVSIVTYVSIQILWNTVCYKTIPDQITKHDYLYIQSN